MITMINFILCNCTIMPNNLFKFHSKAAIYNAYAIIFGGATGNFWYSLYELDYDTNKPQINYDVAALTIPSLLTGTIIGVTLNRFLPEVIILLCLTILICFTLYKIFTRAQRLRREENAALNVDNEFAGDDKKVEEIEMKEKGDCCEENEDNLNRGLLQEEVSDEL